MLGELGEEDDESDDGVVKQRASRASNGAAVSETWKGNLKSRMRNWDKRFEDASDQLVTLLKGQHIHEDIGFHGLKLLVVVGVQNERFAHQYEPPVTFHELPRFPNFRCPCSHLPRSAGTATVHISGRELRLRRGAEVGCHQSKRT